jgi:hypothetical protein
MESKVGIISHKVSLSCPIVEGKYVFKKNTFQNAERSFGYCRGCHYKPNFLNTIDIRIQVFVYRFQCLTRRVYTWSKKMESKVGIISHKPGKVKPSLCETLEPVNKNLYPNIYCIYKIWLIMTPSAIAETPNATLTRLASDIGTGNTMESASNPLPMDWHDFVVYRGPGGSMS